MKSRSLMFLGVALTSNLAIGADIRYMGNGDWSTTSSWQGGVKPGNADSARGNWGNNTVTVTTTESVGGIQWGVDEASTLKIQTGGNLTTTGSNWSGLGAGGPTTGTLFVEGGQLTIGGDFHMGLGGNPYTVSANISSGLMDVNGVFRQDNGSVASGTTTISGTGVLEVNQFSLSGANNTLTFDGGTLKAGAGSANWLTGNGTARINSGGATIDTGAFAVTASTALTQNGASPGGGLTKTGSGTLTLSGSNTYTGGTAVNTGRLIFQDSTAGGHNYAANTGATLEFNVTAGNRQLSGGSITGGGTFVKSGAGQLWLGANGAPQTVTLGSGSLIDVQGGLMRNEYGSSGWGANLADVNVATGAFLDLWDGNITVDAITGSGTINKAWGGTNTLTFGVDNGSGTFSGTISSLGTPSGGGYSGEGGGTLNLVKQGSGTQTLSGSNNYTGSTTVSGGTLRLSGGGSLNNGNYAGAIILSNSANFEKLSNGSQTLSGAITGTGSVKLDNADGQLLLQNAANSYSTLNIGAGRVFIQSSGALPAAATVNLTGGTLDFDAGGTYNSAIAVSSGANIAARAATTLSNVTLPGTGTVIFNNDDASTAALGISSNQTLTGALTVQIGGDRMQSTGGALGGVTLSGNLTGSGSLVVASSGNISNPNFGTGVLTLSGANTYDGATLVSAGTLFVTGSLTSGVTVSDAATLGGGGTMGAVSLAGGSFFDIALAVGGNALDSTATISFSSADFGIDNLRYNGAAVDWSTIADNTYTLISGTLDETNLGNFGSGNAFDIDGISGTRTAYFTNGSLQLVVIPEPGAALLAGLGVLALFRRQR